VTLPTPAELPVPRLIIWRHGRTEWNAIGRFQGQLDPPLDAEGRHQAARVAPHLVASGLAPESTVVLSSDLARASETAAALTALLGVPLRLAPGLREHGLGSWEGLTRDEVATRFPDQYADWVAGRPVSGRGGEEPAAVTARAIAAVAAAPPADVAVAVTHGGTAGRLLEGLLGLEPGQRLFGPLANCAWSELTRHAGRWRLIRHNSWTSPPPVGGLPRRTEGIRRDAGAVPALSNSDKRGNPDDRPVTPEGDADAVG
jgi:probable phosphoglycerate mutase